MKRSSQLTGVDVPFQGALEEGLRPVVIQFCLAERWPDLESLTLLVTLLLDSEQNITPAAPRITETQDASSSMSVAWCSTGLHGF